MVVSLCWLGGFLTGAGGSDGEVLKSLSNVSRLFPPVGWWVLLGLGVPATPPLSCRCYMALQSEPSKAPLLKYRHVAQRRKAHPLVRLLIDKMNEQGVGVGEMCREAGIAKNTFGLWGRLHNPKIDTLEACFNVLGYTLTPMPQDPAGIYNRVSRSRAVYVATDPRGREHQVEGMAAFCRVQELDQFEMYRIVSSGKTHKGWKVRKF